MFHDRQAQSSAADGFGVAFVYAIEAFEDSAAVFSRDSDAVVFDADLYAFSKILQMVTVPSSLLYLIPLSHRL